MRSVSFIDDHYPVRTVFSDQQDWQRYPDWQDSSVRNAVLESYLGIPVREVLFAREIHSGSVFAIADQESKGKTVWIDESHILGSPGGYDSMVTCVPGILLCIWTADCLPLFLYDRKKHTAAIVHCGWRGICSGIAANTLEVMAGSFGSSPDDVIAAIGPCICGQHYEVGEELIGYFSERFSPEESEAFFHPRNNGKYLLDIRRAVLTELLRSGVKPESVFDTGICSYEDHQYASYRRDGLSGRARQMLSGIVLV